MSPGELLYKFFYRPLAFIKRAVKAGIINSVRTELARRNMVKHALMLKETPMPQDLPVYAIYFLTGQKYWYQTAFCLYSLQSACAHIKIKAILIDDGSFTDKLTAQIKSQFPSADIIASSATEQLLDQHLPLYKYKTLRQKRLTYPHLKKLTDVHFQPGDWKMVLDSDMLFFKYPGELTAWLQKPGCPFFLRDPVTSYHYSFSLMEKLAGHSVKENLNVGAIGLNSWEINWDALENWIAELENAEGSSYLLEQALSAMIVAGKSVSVATPGEYIVMPSKKQVNSNEGTLHHYVADSKEWYFKQGWINAKQNGVR